jgi:hypothetical protein
MGPFYALRRAFMPAGFPDPLKAGKIKIAWGSRKQSIKRRFLPRLPTICLKNYFYAKLRQSIKNLAGRRTNCENG